MALLVQRKTLFAVLVVFFAAREAHAQFGDQYGGYGGMGGKPTPCPKFKCPEGQTPLPRVGMSVHSTGCANMGMGMSMNLGGEATSEKALTACCDVRNACLMVCGSARTNCETAFSKCGKKACNSMAGEDKKACESSASMHTMMANMGGCKAYDAGQAAQCECVKDSKVDGHRRDVLKKFYKKHAKAKYDYDKVKGLAKKRSTPSKFAKLMVEMVTKYPKSISKRKDPQQQRYEEMMKSTPPPPPPQDWSNLPEGSYRSSCSSCSRSSDTLSCKCTGSDGVELASDLDLQTCGSDSSDSSDSDSARVDNGKGSLVCAPSNEDTADDNAGDEVIEETEEVADGDAQEDDSKDSADDAKDSADDAKDSADDTKHSADDTKDSADGEDGTKDGEQKGEEEETKGADDDIEISGHRETKSPPKEQKAKKAKKAKKAPKETKPLTPEEEADKTKAKKEAKLEKDVKWREENEKARIKREARRAAEKARKEEEERLSQEASLDDEEIEEVFEEEEEDIVHEEL